MSFTQFSHAWLRRNSYHITACTKCVAFHKRAPDEAVGERMMRTARKIYRQIVHVPNQDRPCCSILTCSCTTDHGIKMIRFHAEETNKTHKHAPPLTLIMQKMTSLWRLHVSLCSMVLDTVHVHGPVTHVFPVEYSLCALQGPDVTHLKNN